MYRFLLSVMVLVTFSYCGCTEARLAQKPKDLGEVRAVHQPATQSKNSFYVSNREPLLPSPFIKLPIRSIDPKGWLRKQLELQADGFHGHLTEISGFLKKENNSWLSKEGIGERGWEEVPYWLKGFSNCAYVLDNADMIDEAQIWIESALNSQKADGWFGPDKGRGGAATRLKGREDLWPNMIMLFCLQGYYDYTGDERVIKLMTNYMKYLTTVPEDKFIVGYWPKMRAADLSFSIYWLYNRTGDKYLLDLGHKAHRRTAEWSKDVINWHNVNMSQAFGGPTTYYMQSKNPIHLEASYRNWQKIRDMYGQVPGGMFGGDENCRPGYTGPRQAIETCGTVEMMLSHETLLTITGDPVWADRCEDVAFNTMPAGFTADMKALRYLTAPNMIQSDSKNKSPGLQNGGPMLHMNPHRHRCCQHNTGHGWPYYAQHIWLATPDNGLAAVLYSASEVTAKVGDGTEVTIAEKTRYPFEEQIVFTISTAKSVPFPLYLRIPAWCKKSVAKVNGISIGQTAPPGTYLIIDRNWSDGDTITLTLPMEINLRTWTKNNNSVSVDRGPLTYSLKIGEKYVRQGGSDDWPAWEIYPTTPWNYGLVLNETDPADGLEVVQKSWPKDDQPFGVNAAPIELKTKAKRIPQWKQDHLGLVGLLQPSPIKSDEPMETITLVPMGSARLRIASFPTIGSGSDAHEWTAPPLPFKGMASYCFGNDSVEAIQDDREPKHSNDHSIPRFTWWPKKGSREWIHYKLDKPKPVSRIEVYWFDDTGAGGCRTPQSWKLLYKDGDKFKEVANPSSFGTEKDKYNLTTFDPVTTSLLRIEVKLKSEFSGGILEVKVK